MLSVLLALAGLYLVQRLVPLPIRQSANTTTGILYGALYVMYGVTLAFSLYLGRQEVSEVKETAEREAGSLEGLYQLAEQLPQYKRDQVQELIESYTRAVVEEEWPLMEQDTKGQESSHAEALVDELQESVGEFEPSTAAEQALYSQGLTLAYDVENHREIRLLQSRQDVHAPLWGILVVGGVLTILLAFFFGTEVLWLHGLLVAALTVIVVLILYATYEVQYPFSGTLRVEPDAYEEVLNDIRREHEH